MLLIQPCEVSDNNCHSLEILFEETSEIPLESLGISTSGFKTNPSPLWSWNLWFSYLNALALSLFPAMWHMAVSDWVAWERENLDVDPWPFVFLQNLELRKSALGNMQHVAPTESALDILLFDTTKSNEISSNVSSKPWTRASRDFNPFRESPKNFGWRSNRLGC